MGERLVAWLEMARPQRAHLPRALECELPGKRTANGTIIGDRLKLGALFGGHGAR
jgi:hypothetical protein